MCDALERGKSPLTWLNFRQRFPEKETQLGELSLSPASHVRLNWSDAALANPRDIEKLDNVNVVFIN